MKNNAITAALLAAGLVNSVIPASAQGLSGQLRRPTHGPQPPQQRSGSDLKYRSRTVFYQPDGRLVVDVDSSEQLFDSAQDCDRYTTDRLKAAVNDANGKAHVLGDSVFMPGDGSGYVWFGCIHPSDLNSEAYKKYTDVKMTPERAEQMKRFPDFGDR